MQTDILSLDVLTLTQIEAHIRDNQLLENEVPRVIYLKKVTSSLIAHLQNEDTRAQATLLVKPFTDNVHRQSINFPRGNLKKGSLFNQLEAEYARHDRQPEPVVQISEAPIETRPVVTQPTVQTTLRVPAVTPPTDDDAFPQSDDEDPEIARARARAAIAGIQAGGIIPPIDTPVVRQVVMPVPGRLDQRVAQTLNNLGHIGSQHLAPVSIEQPPIHTDTDNVPEPIPTKVYYDFNGQVLPNLSQAIAEDAPVIMGVYDALLDVHPEKPLNQEELNYCAATAEYLNDAAKEKGWNAAQVLALHAWETAFRTLASKNIKLFPAEQTSSKTPIKKSLQRNADTFSVRDKKNQRPHVLLMSKISYYSSTPAGKVVAALLIAGIAIGLSFATFGAAPIALALAGVFAFTVSLAAHFLFRKEKIGFVPTHNNHAQFMARLGRLMPQSNLAKFVTGLGLIALVAITIAVSLAMPPALALLPAQIALGGIGIGLLTSTWPLMVRGVEKAIAKFRHPEGSPIKRIGREEAHQRFENYAKLGEWQGHNIQFEKHQSWLCQFGATPRKQRDPAKRISMASVQKPAPAVNKM